MKTIRALPILLLLAGACDTESPGGGGAAATARDSAGIRIVENGDADWAGAPWRLSDEPTLQIGRMDGDPAYMFDRVRAALRLSDGRIAVGNIGSYEVRFYGPDGRHLRSVGRKGAGPGEFNGMTFLRRLPGDTLMVFEGVVGRITLLGPDGRLARMEQAPVMDGLAVDAQGRFTDGTLLASRNVARFREVPAGMRRDTLLWMRVDPRTKRVDTLPTTPGSESFVNVSRAASGMVMMGMMSFPFMRDVHTAMVGDRYWQGASDAYELVLRRADGTPERIVRRRVKAVPVAGAYLDSVRRVREAESGPAAGSAIDAVPLPDRLPAFARILADDEGNLWVQRTKWPGYVPTEWDVFDPEGTMRGTLAMPAGFHPTHIGGDFVLGVWKDEDNVEYVRMYRLAK